MKLLTSLLLTLLAAPCWEGTALPADEPDRPLRILTYNIFHGGPTSGFKDDGSRLEARLDMVVRELQALEPDIIAIQEASWSRRHGDVPHNLAQRLGLHLVFAAATERLFGIRLLDQLVVGLLGFKEGPAILSRFPIAASETYDLPRCQRFFDPRILLRAQLATPWGPLQVFSTHTAGDACQTQRVGEIVRAHQGPGPSVLMGDFNTLESSPELSALREEAGFVDVFRFANPDLPGPTVWQRIDAPQRTVSRRVDYIFLVNGQETTGTVRSSRVVFDQPGRLPDGATLWPSDHYGVFAELDLPPFDAAVHATAY